MQTTLMDINGKVYISVFITSIFFRDYYSQLINNSKYKKETNEKITLADKEPTNSRILNSMAWAPDSTIWIPYCKWDLVSGFQLLVGLGICWAVSCIPKPRIPQAKSNIQEFEFSLNALALPPHPTPSP